MKLHPSHWLFALKLYLAIMLAYVISARMGLAQTYWTVVTCCVVMNPMSGAMRSKAVYRFCGTLCAGVVSLTLASFLSQAPVLMLACVGLVASAAFGASLLDRTPRSYGIQLMGITLMIIAVPAVDAPDTLFDQMVTRSCEIGLAILCCTVVDSILMPRSLGPTVRTRMGGWLKDMERWIDEAFSGRQADAAATQDRIRVLGDISSLSVLASQLRYDPLVTRKERRTAFCLQARLLHLVPLLYGIASRVADAGPRLQAALRKPLGDAARSAHAGRPADRSLPDRIMELEPEPGDAPEWRRLVQENLAEMSESTLNTWAEIRRFERAYTHKEALPSELAKEVKLARTFTLRPDVYLATRVFLGCLLTFTLLALFWAATGWSSGSLMLFQAVVILAFCGGSDVADLAILATGRIVVIALAAAGIMSYGLLPLAKDLTSFAFVMALFIFPAGAWTAKNPIGILITAIAFSSINFQRSYAPYSFDVFLDACVANLVGVFVAFTCVKLVRSMGAKHAVERLLWTGRRDIARLTRHSTPRERDSYLNRSLNRIGLLAERMSGTADPEQGQRIMRGMRAGACVADLRYYGNRTEGELRKSLERLLAAFRTELNQSAFTDRLRARIDETLSTAWGLGIRSARDPFLRSLVSLRLVLFEFSEAWRPVP
ncbi:FUSC family protein [Coraliomargarita parva]|uniref:FUSC family protein n=1 Tax=Coraliomargarita parva TaxID=3014050 RepID=UPI0022B5E25F|nr:FUSC family protein [Coraliomargarita parva]